LAYNDKGNQIVSCSKDLTIKIIDAETKDLIKNINTEQGYS